MKKMLIGMLFLIIVSLLLACNGNDNSNNEDPIISTGTISLPYIMSVDSSDGDVLIPYEIDGDQESITWTSSDTEILSIDEQGLVTAHDNGKVIITATSGEHVSTMEIVSTKDRYTDYIRISTKAQFLMIFSNPANFNSPDKRYILTNDIDFGGDSIEPIGGWDLSNEDTPIDSNRQFRATLDGRGYALKNFSIRNSSLTSVSGSYFGVSLIPFIYDGKVLNLNIIDATFSGTGFTGSVAGKIEKGTIENVFIRATITSRSDNLGIPAGGVAGIVGPDAIIKNVILDVTVNGGFIFAGFNFGNGSYSNAVSETLGDSERRRPIQFTATSTLKDNEEEDAALKTFINSSRIESEDLGLLDSYMLTGEAKDLVWYIVEGYMPFLIRPDGKTPEWALIQ
jgi:hypothetical protein